MALSDYFRPDLFRARNLVPAGIAIVVVAGAWFGIRQTQTDEAPPAAQQAASAPVEAPSPEAPPPAEPEISPTVLVASRDIGRGVLLNMDLVEWREWLEPVDLSRAVIKDAVPLESVIGAVIAQGYHGRRTYHLGKSRHVRHAGIRHRCIVARSPRDDGVGGRIHDARPDYLSGRSCGRDPGAFSGFRGRAGWIWAAVRVPLHR